MRLKATAARTTSSGYYLLPVSETHFTLITLENKTQ